MYVLFGGTLLLQSCSQHFNSFVLFLYVGAHLFGLQLFLLQRRQRQGFDRSSWSGLPGSWSLLRSWSELRGLVRLRRVVPRQAGIFVNLFGDHFHHVAFKRHEERFAIWTSWILVGVFELDHIRLDAVQMKTMAARQRCLGWAWNWFLAQSTGRLEMLRAMSICHERCLLGSIQRVDDAVIAGIYFGDWEVARKWKVRICLGSRRHLVRLFLAA